MVVADGRMENVLPRILDGEEVGTLFVPAGRKLLRPQPLDRRARGPAGTIVVDDGAARRWSKRTAACCRRGSCSVEGDFERGDVVAIRRRRRHGSSPAA